MQRLTPRRPDQAMIERVQHLESWRARGQAAERACDYKEAVGAWEEVLRMEPADTAAWCQLGTAWLNLRNLPSAEACMKQALRVRPTFLPALVGLADCLTLQGKAREAIPKLERARALLKPGDPARLPFHLARGNALYAVGKLREAEAAYRVVVEEAPTWATAWATLGNLYCDTGRYQPALEAFRKAWDLSGSPQLAMNYSLTCLMLEQWEEGWTVYRERLRDLNMEGFRRFQPVKPWHGRPLKGNLLVYAEQGLGDLVQFSRYLPLIRDRIEGLIYLEVGKESLTLFQTAKLASDALIIRPEIGVPKGIEFSSWVGLMDLVPLSGKFDPKDAPLPVKFGISAPKQDGVTVCLHWQGNRAHGNDAQRSIPLKLLAPIVKAHPEIQWLATTPDKKAQTELKDSGLPIALHTGSLLESAERWAGCHLMVTVDSGPAHIAASLGVPTWILTAMPPDWRWGADGATSPWYPSVRLFRQERGGDWKPVIRSLSEALTQFSQVQPTPAG